MFLSQCCVQSQYSRANVTGIRVNNSCHESRPVLSLPADVALVEDQLVMTDEVELQLLQAWHHLGDVAVIAYNHAIQHERGKGRVRIFEDRRAALDGENYRLPRPRRLRARSGARPTAARQSLLCPMPLCRG